MQEFHFNLLNYGYWEGASPARMPQSDASVFVTGNIDGPYCQRTHTSAFIIILCKAINICAIVDDEELLNGTEWGGGLPSHVINWSRQSAFHRCFTSQWLRLNHD